MTATPEAPGEQLRLRIVRLLIGLHGLALLRGWPLDDPQGAERELDAIRMLLSASSHEPVTEPIDVRHTGVSTAYEIWAATYDDPSNSLIAVEEPVMRDVLRALPIGRALDVATGTGRIAEILLQLGHEVTGFDPSLAMLDVARSKLPAVEFIEAALDELPVEDDAADVVTCSLALTHLADLSAPVAELARVTRPGGHVVISDIHPVAVTTGGHAHYRGADGSRGVTRNHEHWTSDYVRAFGEAGLQVLRCEEPRVDGGFFELLKLPEVRVAADPALRGLPLAIIWVLRKRALGTAAVLTERSG